MSVTQYIGARYVPLFSDPLTWDITKTYEPLTIVYYQGNSFTSKQYVPAGIDITNTDYWAITGNYNAQIEQYRLEVQTFNDRITANTTSNSAQDAQLAGTTSSGLKTAIDANTAGVATNASDIDALEGQMAGTSASGLKTAIDNEVTARTAADTAINAEISDINGALNSIILTGHSFSGQKSIGFGDSNMRGTQAGAESIVYKKLCNALGCTYDNQGVSGAAFDLDAALNIFAQVNAASYDPDVRLVVLIGGINDWHYQTSLNNTGFRNAVSTTLSAIHAKFPNAVVVTSFDQGQQWPSCGMLTFPYEMKKLTETAFSRDIFIDSVDLVFNRDAMFYNQNHYSNEGTTLMAERMYRKIVGREYSLFQYAANGTTLTGLTGSLATHTARFDPNTQSIINDYEFEMYQPTYTQESIPASTNVFDVLGGFTMMPHNNSAVFETPIPFKNPSAASIQTDNNSVVFRFYMQNVMSRNQQDCHMSLRNRGNMIMTNYNNMCAAFPVTFTQTPKWHVFS